MSDKNELLLIALGGNALIETGSKGSVKNHLVQIELTVKQLLNLFRKDMDIILTHGNGPQIGNLLIQNEEASSKVPSMTLDVCVAESQGQIGYLLQQTLRNNFNFHNIKKDAVVVLTRVIVDRKDPEFEKPSKPVGPYYNNEQARRLIKQKKWIMEKDPSGRGYRRVVPSPNPIRIVEARTVQQLIFLNHIPIAAGGGGIPVYIDEKKGYIGVEAVVDKDLASAQLAIDLKVDKFIILTNVPICYLNYKKRNQIALKDMNLDEAQTYLEQGQFTPGSMGPKVLAAVKYLIDGGKEAYITDIKNAQRAIEKKAGTYIHH